MKFSEEEKWLYDFPIEGTFDLANVALTLNPRTVLDVGFGAGGASTFFASSGLSVTSIGLDVDSYTFNRKTFKKFGIKFHQTSLEEFKSEEAYDLIWASHVLEHTLNVGLFLDKCATLLSENGWLCVMVPQYKSYVVGGHINTGWNLGQLMYVLLLNGYDIKHGHFIHHGYSLCAFIQKSKKSLPALRMDIGDIEATANLWPIEVKQGFSGIIKQVNWFDDFKAYELNRCQVESLQQQNMELKRLQEKNSTIITSIREEVREEREKLKALYSQQPTLKQKISLYTKYKKSNLSRNLQLIKKIPVIGHMLIFVKRKILNWNY